MHKNSFGLLELAIVRALSGYKGERTGLRGADKASLFIVSMEDDMIVYECHTGLWEDRQPCMVLLWCGRGEVGAHLRPRAWRVASPDTVLAALPIVRAPRVNPKSKFNGGVQLNMVVI